MASGYSEVVLTGVDLTSWGADLEGAPKLGALSHRILKAVPELKRLRLSSIDSIEADPELMDVIAGEERVMPHIHLSLQSGDNMILKRMKRRHAREDSIAFCAELRARRPGIVFGADIIAGFPTETDEMFENSLAIVDDCGLTYLHVFPFSPRPGTPAARMPQLEKAVIKARAALLRQKGEERLDQFLEQRDRRHAPGAGRDGGHGPHRAFRPGEVREPHGARRHRHRAGHRPRCVPSRGQARRMSFFKKLFGRGKASRRRAPATRRRRAGAAGA